MAKDVKHKANLDALPSGSNPLAVRIGKLCRLYRQARGLTNDQAAETLGIDGGLYNWVERGRVLPTSQLADRIGRWLLDKVDFTGVPIESEPKPEYKKGLAVKVRLTAKDRRLLRIRAKRLGLTLGDLATIYVRRGLLSETTFTTLEQAKKELDEGRAAAVMAESPALAAAVHAELGLIERTVAIPTHISELKKLEVPCERVANLPESVANSTEPKRDANLLLTETLDLCE